MAAFPGACFAFFKALSLTHAPPFDTLMFMLALGALFGAIASRIWFFIKWTLQQS